MRYNYEVEISEHLCSNTRVTFQQTKSSVGEWMGWWVGVKAVLRIVYSDQKLVGAYEDSHFSSSVNQSDFN